MKLYVAEMVQPTPTEPSFLTEHGDSFLKNEEEEEAREEEDFTVVERLECDELPGNKEYREIEIREFANGGSL